MNNTTISVGEWKFFFDESGKVLKDSEGNEISHDIKKISEGEFSVIINGKSFRCLISGNHASTAATLNNRILSVDRETMRDKLTKQLQQDAGSSASTVTLRAPMPGLVTKVLKKEGSTVSKGDGLMVVEAMKMENELKAPKDGTIVKIYVTEKQKIEKNDNLITIE